MTEEEKSVWLKTSTEKEYKLHFYDSSIPDILTDQIYMNEFQFEDTLCDSDDLVFGKCSSAKLEVQVLNLEADVVGKEMEVSIICEGVTALIGVFVIKDAPKRMNKKYKKIVAFDRMQYLKTNMAHWYNTVLPEKDSTVSMKQFRDSFFAYLGLPQAETTLINDDLIVHKTVDTNLISGIEIMQAVCETNGVFGHFNNLGVFIYVTIHKDVDLRMMEVDDYITTDYESYSVAGINQLQIRNEEGDIGRIEPQEEIPDANAYIVSSNFLCYGMTDAELEVVAERLLEAIRDIVYTPAITELPGMPYMELGTVYQLVINEETVTSIVLKHTLSGGQALRSVFESSGEQYREEDIDGLNYQFEQLRGRYNKLVRTVDETISELGAIDKELGLVSTIARQTASYFETTVTQEGETLSRFTQVLGKFLFEGESFAINTDNIKIDGPVLEIDNGYIGGIKIGSEGLSSEDYETLQIFKDGTGKFTNLSAEGKGFIYLKAQKDENDPDEEPIVPYFKTKDGFHADYDTAANMSANMHCDSAGYAHYGLVSGDMETSNEPAEIEIVLKQNGAYIQSGNGVLKPIIASNTVGGSGGGGGINYSTDEQLIGTWIDGKPLYQKTWIKTDINIPPGRDTEVGTIPDMENTTIRNTSGFVYINEGVVFATLAATWDNTARFVTYINDGGVIVMISSAGWKVSGINLTVQYTKTTD